MTVKEGLLDMLQEAATGMLQGGNDGDLPATVCVRPEHMLAIVAEIRRARNMTRTMRQWRQLGREAPMTADELLECLCEALED
jgi:hypothetical protein